ncbi:MAG: class IV adenylate cyclase [Acidobacteria bacterium]|nr:class IV adenylate cyclase [Acidobacteriota bacterium]
MAVEREVKLPFPSVAAARAAIAGIGAAPLHTRRLQQDALLDTDERQLRAARSALRLRREGHESRVTFKGPPEPGVMKVREELETTVGDAEVMQTVLEAVGFHVWFRYEKYREEFALPRVVIALDETPIGVFVEIEGAEADIDAVARALGRGRDDYLTDSYRALFDKYKATHGKSPADMTFASIAGA